MQMAKSYQDRIGQPAVAMAVVIMCTASELSAASGRGTDAVQQAAQHLLFIATSSTTTKTFIFDTRQRR
jgi:hypothetical protein